jgi:hypothetical protein
MNSGDRRGAVTAFEEARAAGERGAALLAGICLYELDEDARAEPLLREAEGDPPSRDTARFFLGLLALRGGRSGQAAALLDAAAADRELAPLALGLSRAARSSGKLVLSVALESGWDSNADLTPGASAAPSGAADGEAGLAAALSFAPRGARGPYLRASGTWTEQARFEDLDLLGAGLAAGWQVRSGRHLGAVEWGYDVRRLGGDPYVSAHRVAASAHLSLSAAVAADLAWEGKAESFRTQAADPHSGVRHEAAAELALGLHRGWSVGAAWRAVHDGARSDSLASWEHGPRLSARREIRAGLRAGGEIAFSWRPFDASDPDLGILRRDRYLDASALLEWDLRERVTLRLAVAARRAFSSLSDFEYTRIVPTVGLAYARGLL